MNPVARDSLMIAPVPFQNRPAHCRPSVPGPTMQPIRARTSAPRRGEGAVARRTTEVTASAPPATRPIVESSSMDSTRSTSDWQLPGWNAADRPGHSAWLLYSSVGDREEAEISDGSRRRAADPLTRRRAVG